MVSHRACLYKVTQTASGWEPEPGTWSEGHDGERQMNVASAHFLRGRSLRNSPDHRTWRPRLLRADWRRRRRETGRDGRRTPARVELAGLLHCSEYLLLNTGSKFQISETKPCSCLSDTTLTSSPCKEKPPIAGPTRSEK